LQPNFRLKAFAADDGFLVPGAVVADDVAAFFLADLVAIYGVVEEKGKIGVKLKIVFHQIDLVFEKGAVAKVFKKNQAHVRAARFAAFRVINGPEAADAPIGDGPERYLAGVVPLAYESGK